MSGGPNVGTYQGLDPSTIQRIDQVRGDGTGGSGGGGGGGDASAANQTTGNNILGQIRDKIISAPATEATLGNIRDKIIAAPATEAKQDSGNTLLTAIRDKSGPVDAVPNASPYNSSTANVVFGTVDCTGYNTIELFVTAYSTPVFVEEQASDGSNKWQALPITNMSSAANGLPRVSNAITVSGLYRVAVGGRTIRFNGVSAVAGTTIAVVLKTSSWTAPSTWVEGGTIVVNSSTVTADTSGTLVAAASGVQLFAASSTRQFMTITNTGSNVMQIRFGAAPTATVGHSIGAGGSFVFDTKCPTAAVFGFSTAGTSWFASTG